MKAVIQTQRRTKPNIQAPLKKFMMCLWTFVFASTLGIPMAWSEVGVTKDTIRIGGVMDLKGRSRGLGQGMKMGIRAALRNQTVVGRRIEFVTLDDSYTPSKTIKGTKQLIKQGIFLMMGNVGTPTAKVSLPILAKNKVPALGFFTGAGILRPGVGNIINYRASYVQETAAVITSAIRHGGIRPTEICAYVQNDAYGMAGVVGIKRALQNRPGTQKIIVALDNILSQQGENPARNDLGPVGVYQRNTFTSKSGYHSLKLWEIAANTRCKLVVAVGTYNSITKFAAYSRYKGDKWIVSAVSFTGADNFRNALASHNVNDKIIMSQVVPPFQAGKRIKIVQDAARALGDKLGYVSLEGYIVGRLLLEIMHRMNGQFTRKNFLRAVQGRKFNLAGLSMDFSNDNQGSDLVLLTYLTSQGYQTISQANARQVWLDMLKE